MAVFAALPLLKNSGNEKAQGIAVLQVSAPYTATDGSLITRAISHARIVDGSRVTEAGTPLEVVATPSGVGLEMWLRIDEPGSGVGRYEEVRWLVAIPATATVAIDTLVHLEPADVYGVYVPSPEVQALLDAATTTRNEAAASAAAAATSATTAGTARDEAVSAKNAAQAVGTTTDGVMTGVDGNAASTFRVQSDARLSATFDRSYKTSYESNLPLGGLTRVSKILTSRQSFEAAAQDGPGCIFTHPISGRLAMLYTGYDSLSTTTGIGVGIIAYSDDGGVTWGSQEKYIEKSGISGAPDEYGVTGPTRTSDGVTEYVFYIGLNQPGYERGTKQVCMSKRTIGTSTWTRMGTQIAPSGTGWRKTYIWKPSFFESRGEVYCFVNASGDNAPTTTPDLERIGVFRSTSKTYDGPWEEVTDSTGATINPLFPETASIYKVREGDGTVFVWNDQPAMMYFRARTSDPQNASIMLATTTWAQFPDGWVERSVLLSSLDSASVWDNRFTHKGVPFDLSGRMGVIYTAVDQSNVRSLALAVSGGPRWAYAQLSTSELSASRTTTSITNVSVAQATVLFDPMARTTPQLRMLVRANPGSTATLTVTDLRTSSTLTVTGSGWQNVSSPWTNITETALFQTYPLFKSSDGTTVSIGNVHYEIRWSRV